MLSLGRATAAIILAGRDLGMAVSHVRDAEHFLAGQTPHPTVFCAMEREACRLNDLVRAGGAPAVAAANDLALSILARNPESPTQLEQQGH